jgi:hypothetical protein
LGERCVPGLSHNAEKDVCCGNDRETACTETVDECGRLILPDVDMGEIEEDHYSRHKVDEDTADGQRDAAGICGGREEPLNCVFECLVHRLIIDFVRLVTVPIPWASEAQGCRWALCRVKSAIA